MPLDAAKVLLQAKSKASGIHSRPCLGRGTRVTAIELDPVYRGSKQVAEACPEVSLQSSYSFTSPHGSLRVPQDGGTGSLLVGLRRPLGVLYSSASRMQSETAIHLVEPNSSLWVGPVLLYS